MNGDLVQPFLDTTKKAAKIIQDPDDSRIVPVLTFTDWQGTDKDNLDNVAAFVAKGANEEECEEMMFMFDASFNEYFNYGGQDFLGAGHLGWVPHDYLLEKVCICVQEGVCMCTFYSFSACVWHNNCRVNNLTNTHCQFFVPSLLSQLKKLQTALN